MTPSARAWRMPAVALLLAAGAACAPAPMRLPEGPGAPAADFAPAAAEAFRGCGTLRTVTAELGLSGRVGDERLRGRLLAGFERPRAIRLEAVAPFGPPVFILASRERAATLLLPRDDRLLTGEPPEDILRALAGIALDPALLRALVAGCPADGPDARSALRHGDEWMSLPLGAGHVVWLKRSAGRWRVVAGTIDAVRYEFTEYFGDRPRRVRLRTTLEGASAPVPVDVRLEVSQLELNVDLPAEAFAVRVPPDAVPLTLEELRRNGPLRRVPE